MKIFTQHHVKGLQHADNRQFEDAKKEYIECCEMLEIGKTIFAKEQYRFWPLCIYTNLACIYQQDWKIEKSNKYLQKSQQFLQNAIREQILNSPNQKEKYLSLSAHLIKMKYRQCAILSQLNQNQKAIETCQSVLPIIRKNIETIQQHAKNQLKTQKKQNDNFGVRFGPRVYKYALEIFQRLLKRLQTSTRAFQPSTVSKPELLNSFYYWEKNPERNQQQLRNCFIPSSFENTEGQNKRSVLGIKKEKTWLDDFNIGLLMKMTMTDIKEWTKVLPMEEYLFKKMVQQFVIFTSIGYFTMATEIRFIDAAGKQQMVEAAGKNQQEDETQKEKQNIQQNYAQQQQQQNYDKAISSQQTPSSKKSDEKEPESQNKSDYYNKANKVSEIKKKYGYEKKTERFALSESHHLTSIAIVTQNIQSLIPYLSHLIKSYDKHYIFKKNLDEILAIPEESMVDQSKLSHHSGIGMGIGIGSSGNLLSRAVSNNNSQSVNEQIRNQYSPPSSDKKDSSHNFQNSSCNRQEQNSSQKKSQQQQQQLIKLNTERQQEYGYKIERKQYKPQNKKNTEGVTTKTNNDDNEVIQQKLQKHTQQQQNLAKNINANNNLVDQPLSHSKRLRTPKTQRKTNHYTSASKPNIHVPLLYNSVRHKSAGKCRKSRQKLYQTVSNSRQNKRKTFTQESANMLQTHHGDINHDKLWQEIEIQKPKPKLKLKTCRKSKRQMQKYKAYSKKGSTAQTTQKQVKKQKKAEKIGKDEKMKTSHHHNDKGVKKESEQKHPFSTKNPNKNQKIKQKLNNLVGKYDGDSELHVKHKSCTSYKLVFKKEK